MHKYVAALLFLLGVSNTLIAQEKKVIGRLVDAETKQAIPYVNIGVFQKNIGTVSDENGNFVLGFSEYSTASDSIIFCILDTKRLSMLYLNCLNQLAIFH